MRNIHVSIFVNSVKLSAILFLPEVVNLDALPVNILTLHKEGPLWSYRNQSVDWCLYDSDLSHERVNKFTNFIALVIYCKVLDPR